MALLRKGEEPIMISSGRFKTAQAEPAEDHAVRLVVQGGVQKDIGIAAQYMVSAIAPSRELSLALTALEEALMWAGKAIFK